MGYDDDAPGPDEIGQDSGGPERGPEATFAVGAVVGAAVLGVVWLLVAMLTGGSSEAPDNSADATVVNPWADSPAAEPEVASPEVTSTARCASAATALGGPLRAAGPAMDQWAVHIGAMNKLVVGAITLQQATAFWDRTRVGAAQRINQFRHAMQLMRKDGLDCPSPGLLSRTAAADLRSCVRRVDADLRTMKAARTAINTWQMHVADMERLRAGTLSPAAASQMWLRMWQRGQHQLDAYRTAARTARQAGTCGQQPAAANAPSARTSRQPSTRPSGRPSMQASTQPPMDPSMQMSGMR
jgi:hypothetical protein